ncbi:MAG: ATP-binding cassette domain-containing protein [Pseudomonadota bacterium]
MEMSPGLRIEALGFRFDARPVFERFSLTRGAGITWLRGANGSGKTTLLKLIGGALVPGAGSIAFGAFDSVREPLAYRRNSFFSGGDTPELPWLTVQELLDLHLALYPGADPQLLNTQLNAFRMLATLPQSVATLSLGQHKKLQLALTLPVGLLLLDEPLNGLDAAAAAYLRGALGALAEAGKVCVVLTSHLDPLLPVLSTYDLEGSAGA